MVSASFGTAERLNVSRMTLYRLSTVIDQESSHGSDTNQVMLEVCKHVYIFLFFSFGFVYAMLSEDGMHGRVTGDVLRVALESCFAHLLLMFDIDMIGDLITL